MRDLPLELLGSAFLRRTAGDVETFDPALHELVQAMFRTMYRAGGQGLAAPQVGVLQRIVVIDMPDEDSPALALINPRIISQSASTRKAPEGCLSIPGVSAPVERSTEVVIEAWTPDGTVQRIEASGELAACLQHEIDHLDGILYIDHLSPLQRALVLKRYDKLRKHRRA
jgi:peptide deformylase